MFKVFLAFSFLFTGLNASQFTIHASDGVDGSSIIIEELQDGDVIEIPLVSKDRYVAARNADTLRMEYSRNTGFHYWITVTSCITTDFYGRRIVTGPGTNKTFYVSGLFDSISLYGLTKGTNYSATMIGQTVGFKEHVIANTVPNAYGFQF